MSFLLPKKRFKAALLTTLLCAGVLASLAAAPTTKSTRRPTRRPATRPMATRPRGPELEDFAGGRKTRRTIVNAIDRKSITVAFKPDGTKEAAEPEVKTFAIDAQTRVLVSVPDKLAPNVKVDGGLPVRLRFGTTSEVKKGSEIEIAADEDERAVLLVTVLGEDLVIVGLPPLPSALARPATRPTSRPTTRMTTAPATTRAAS